MRSQPAPKESRERREAKKAKQPAKRRRLRRGSRTLRVGFVVDQANCFDSRFDLISSGARIRKTYSLLGIMELNSNRPVSDCLTLRHADGTRSYRSRRTQPSPDRHSPFQSWIFNPPITHHAGHNDKCANAHQDYAVVVKR